MIHWALPIALVVVGFMTDWRPSALVDACWLYNMLIVGLALLLSWKKVQFNVEGWKISTLFVFVLVWPIVRTYGGGAP